MMKAIQDSPMPLHPNSDCVASQKVMPTCSVVICTRERPGQLDECLHATRNLCYPNLDVVVVENGTASNITRKLSNQWDARYLQEPLVGVSRSRNRGARSSTSEIVAFIDDDAVPSQEW